MRIAVDAVYENGALKLDRQLDLAENTRVHLVIETLVGASRTPLGSRLRALREQILETGEPLLDWDDISAEAAARRGGFRGER